MFEVTIDQFNGPLDLMLYLIKEHKLDLFDLDISELTNQYVAYIHAMDQLRLEIASEYLTELAGLVEFKSKKLLPRDESEMDAAKPESEMDLVQRLLEYQKFKEVSQQLNVLYQERMDHYSKSFSHSTLVNLREEVSSSSYVEGDVYDLIKAMEKVLQRFQQAHPLETTIVNQEFSVDDRIDQLRRQINLRHETFTLLDLLRQSQSIYHLVVTFLAVLDMLRMNELLLSINDDEFYLRGNQLDA